MDLIQSLYKFLQQDCKKKLCEANLPEYLLESKTLVRPLLAIFSDRDLSQEEQEKHVDEYIQAIKEQVSSILLFEVLVDICDYNKECVVSLASKGDITARIALNYVLTRN